MCQSSSPNRSQLGSAPGRKLWLHLGNSAPKADLFPQPAETLFNCAEMQKEDVKKSFMKEGEMGPADVFGAEFGVFLTSTFQKDDAVEFLENSLPLHLLKIYNVVQGD